MSAGGRGVIFHPDGTRTDFTGPPPFDLDDPPNDESPPQPEG